MTDSGKTTLLQWFGVLAGPIVALVDLEARYAVVNWACDSGKKFVLFLPTIGALLITALAAIAAWRVLRSLGDESETRAESRARFMAISGLGLSAMFALVIIAFAIPAVLLSPCQP